MIEQSAINEAMRAGNDAFLSGKTADDCPHRFGDARRLWLRGFANAKHMKALDERYKG